MARAPRTPINEMIDETNNLDGTPVQPTDDAGIDNPLPKSSTPLFKKYPESRIPVSKSTGKLWKSRQEQGISKLKSDGTHESWDEAVAYYKNDQTNKRNRDDPDRPSFGPEITAADGAFSTTENIVFSNVSSIVPAIYAKNPDVSVQSTKGDAERPFAMCAQKLIRALMQKRTPPGINLKPKARVGVVRTTLMNISYIEVGYTRREVSSDAALQQIDKIAQELATAKDKNKIEELEGQLMGMDETIDLLQPSGPWARAIHPKDVIADPDATLPDLTDTNWIMIRDSIATSFLNAVYRTKDPETGELKSLYKPTHILKRDGVNRNMQGHDDEITNFTLFATDDQKQPHDYGYDDERSYRRAQRTFVWRIWDRVTRRVYMFAENDWKWPVWVWDDPYGLDDFYTLYPLAFHTDPEDMYARGEVSYYLDQQDEINRINSQISRMRHRISNQLVANKRAVKDEQSIMALVKPVKGDEIVLIDIPEGMKISDVVSAPPVPSVEYAQLFDKKNLLEAIDRVSGVSAVLRNAEFRTNTTNKAIDSYESTTQQRLDEKIDAIEEQIGRIGYAVLIMCLQFMTQDEVAKLIGVESAQQWPPPMDARTAQESFNLTVTGGSSLKPTSKVRKEQAKEIGQILGQFGASNPLAFYIALKVFARAYADEFVLEQSDWDMITGFIEQQLGLAQQEQAGAAPTAAPPGASAGPAAAPPTGSPSPNGGAASMLPQIEAMIAKMPEEIRMKFGEAIAQGIPLSEILGELQQLANGGGNGARPPMQ